MQAEWGVGLIYPWSGPAEHDSPPPLFKMHNEISIMHEQATSCSACSLKQNTLSYRTALAISKHQRRTQSLEVCGFSSESHHVLK